MQLTKEHIIERIKRPVRKKLIQYPRAAMYACALREVLRGNVSICSAVRKIIRHVTSDVKSWLIVLRSKETKRVLENLYQEAILCCVKHSVHRWWVFFHNTKFTSVPLLKIFLREYVLRRAGDYRAYIEISGKLNGLFRDTSGEEEFYERMTKHYAKTIRDIEAGKLYSLVNSKENKRVWVIGVSVWGEHFLNIFTTYCLPSLITPGNFGALCKERKVVLLIHTNKAGEKRISQSEAVKAMQAMGVEIVYRMLDEALLSEIAIHGNHKYWHLGMVQSLDLFFAKFLDADYHLTMPDTVYSASHFSNLLKLVARGHRAIIKSAYRTRLQEVCPEVEKFRHDGMISIPAADLGSIAVGHLHTDSIPLFITQRDLATELPAAHVLIWEGEHGLHLLSPHQTILYLDREGLRKLTNRYFITLDSELDKIIPEDFAVYCPKPEDEINLIEISHDTLSAPRSNSASLREFANVFWQNVESMAHWRFFNESTVDALNRVTITDRHFLQEAEIERAKEAIRAVLLEACPVTTTEQTRMGLELLEAVRTHPSAQAMNTTLIEAAQLMCQAEELPRN